MSDFSFLPQCFQLCSISIHSYLYTIFSSYKEQNKIPLKSTKSKNKNIMLINDNVRTKKTRTITEDDKYALNSTLTYTIT